MVLIPESEAIQRGGGDPMDITADNADAPKGNKIRRHAAERQRKMLSIVLKLASKQLYDTAGRFDTKNGKVEIAPLLMYALTPGRTYPALDEFVDVLHIAGVTADEVINGSVKEMLRARANDGKTYMDRRSTELPAEQGSPLDVIAARPPPPPVIPEAPQPQSQEELKRLAIVAQRRLARRATKFALNNEKDVLKLAGVPVPEKRKLDDVEADDADNSQKRWRLYGDDES